MKTTVVSALTLALAAGALTFAAPGTANAGQVHVDVHLGFPVVTEPVVVYQPAYPVVVYHPPVVRYGRHGHHHHHHYRHHTHHGHHYQHHWGHGGHHSKRIAGWQVNPRIDHRR